MFVYYNSQFNKFNFDIGFEVSVVQLECHTFVTHETALKVSGNLLIRP